MTSGSLLESEVRIRQVAFTDSRGQQKLTRTSKMRQLKKDYRGVNADPLGPWDIRNRGELPGHRPYMRYVKPKFGVSGLER